MNFLIVSIGSSFYGLKNQYVAKKALLAGLIPLGLDDELYMPIKTGIFLISNYGDYKRSGTKLQSFLVKISKTFWFLWLYLNSISFKYKGNFRMETP